MTNMSVDLSTVSTEDLRKELRRRRKKPRPSNLPKYIEWRGKVVFAHEWGKYRQFKYTVVTEDSRVEDDSKKCIFPIDYRNIKFSNRPKVGDQVVIRLRYTKKMHSENLIYWSLGKIIKVL